MKRTGSWLRWAFFWPSSPWQLVLYLHLHVLPDRIAHNKVQLQIVCVLGLLAMFTHMHIFWIAGLLLALVDIPDFITPLKRIVAATETIAGARHRPE